MLLFSSILYAVTLAFLVATLALGLHDGSEHRSGIRATVAALLCLACMWANWQLMYSMIQDTPTCETSTEVTID